MKQDRSRKKGQRPPDAGRCSGLPAVPAKTFSTRRKWLFRFVAIVVVPLILLGGLELLLRVFGAGFDPHFFKRTKIGGKDCYVSNGDFGLRFFPRRLARAPLPVVMSAAKAPGTCRIFIFGESAAMGDPRPNYGAGAYLDVLLSERFPGTKFEIINTGITAINSHTILPITRECSRHSGDLWLVYMGNNEMVGPFGAAEVFGTAAPPVWLTRAQLQLRRLRIAQVLLEAGQGLGKSKSETASWHGMEMFVHNQVPPNDPRKQRVYRNFEQNLNDILRAGLNSGARIVLSTVAVNLKDCPPFGTLSEDDLDVAKRAEYEKFSQNGAAAEAQNRFADAESDFRRASEIFPQSAETQFRLASCLLHQTNGTAARQHFLRAVDTDTLPFRADSRINDVIRGAARKFAGESLVLCDAAEVLGTNSPNGISGEEQFYEHVHPNPDGNYALAVAWADQVERLLEPALKRGARENWVSQSECEQLLGLTDWNRVSIVEEIQRRVLLPPFSGQIGNKQQVARLQAQIDSLHQRLTPEAVVRAREVYQGALRRAPENVHLHESFAEFLEAVHDLNLAITERQKVCELIPNYYFPHYTLGIDLKEAGKLADARRALLKAAELKPDECDVQLELGIVYARQSEWESARQYLEGARRLGPEDPRIPLYLGEVLWKQERRGEAIASLREAIRLAPLDWQPHFRLASDLAQERDFSGAAAEYQEVLRLKPAYVKAKVGLAVVLLETGRRPEALRQLDEALALEPNNRSALELQRKIRGM
ncbi:MAG TPA: tetratricopeptide repeat protein [Candidatus Paceibacterota bacterium]|nr:tetratricopeptide repeat protein [Candidatus Paceibacterota bacterium]